MDSYEEIVWWCKQQTKPLSLKLRRAKAESEGFEPPVPSRVHRISSATRSTTLAAFQMDYKVMIILRISKPILEGKKGHVNTLPDRNSYFFENFSKISCFCVNFTLIFAAHDYEQRSPGVLSTNTHFWKRSQAFLFLRGSTKFPTLGNDFSTYFQNFISCFKRKCAF